MSIYIYIYQIIYVTARPWSGLRPGSSSRERNRIEKRWRGQREGGETRKKDFLILERSHVGSYKEQGSYEEQ